MRVIVVGLGNQGRKRRDVAGAEVVATIDPLNPEADYRSLEEVPTSGYDAALVCTPDDAKYSVLRELVERGKHVLVEKPLLPENRAALVELQQAAERARVTLYTAYNHRFEPHFIRTKEVLDSGVLGEIYSVQMLYANGTARDVRNSAWRDAGWGVLPDLGSHLLDTVLFFLGRRDLQFELRAAECFENKSLDYVGFATRTAQPLVTLEATLLSWRNTFRLDIYAQHGSLHVDCLCKWGPSRFTLRKRRLPSGRPDEETSELICADPTWRLEYEHFKSCCQRAESNIENDLWIGDKLQSLYESLRQCRSS